MIILLTMKLYDVLVILSDAQFQAVLIQARISMILIMKTRDRQQTIQLY